MMLMVLFAHQYYVNSGANYYNHSKDSMCNVLQSVSQNVRSKKKKEVFSIFGGKKKTKRIEKLIFMVAKGAPARECREGAAKIQCAKNNTLNNYITEKSQKNFIL